MAGQQGHRLWPGQAVPLKVRSVVCLLASQAGSRQVVSRDSRQEEAQARWGQLPGGGSGQPPFGPPGDLPSGRPDVIGRVRSVAGDSITLETPQGPRLVMVNDETEVKRAEGEEEVSLEDIEPGTPIAVFGQFNGEGKTLVAQVIIILPPPSKK